MRFARRVFRVVVVDRVVADDLQRRQHLQVGGGENPDRNLGACGEALHQDAPVVLRSKNEPARHLVSVARNREPDRRTFPDRLDHQRQAEPQDQPLDDVRAHSGLELELVVLGYEQTRARHDGVGARLVHTQR